MATKPQQEVQLELFAKDEESGQANPNSTRVTAQGDSGLGLSPEDLASLSEAAAPDGTETAWGEMGY